MYHCPVGFNPTVVLEENSRAKVLCATFCINCNYKSSWPLQPATYCLLEIVLGNELLVSSGLGKKQSQFKLNTKLEPFQFNIIMLNEFGHLKEKQIVITCEIKKLTEGIYS